VALPKDEEPEYAGHLLSELLAYLDAPDTERREWAAWALWGLLLNRRREGKPVPAVAVLALIDALRDPEGRVRGRAAMALGEAGEAARYALPRLIELLADDEEEDGARAQIANAVADLGGAREAATILLRLLRTGADEVREAAAVALQRAVLSGLGVEGELRAGLSDESLVVRTWVCWSLWRLTRQGGEFIPLLLTALREERTRLDAARLLCWMKDQARAVLPELLALRDDSDWMVRLQAVKATLLVPCSNEVALPVLESLLDDPHKVVRSFVAGALKERGRI
jgi:HEAT repeat protein